MKTSKKEIRENTKTTKVSENSYYHIYHHVDGNFSVRTFGFGRRPAEQVETASGYCIGYAPTKEEFVSIVHDYIN